MGARMFFRNNAPGKWKIPKLWRLYAENFPSYCQKRIISRGQISQLALCPN